MFRMGVRSIALRTASIDLLLGLSTLGTVALSIANLVRGEPHVYFDAAAMLVTLRLAGHLIETRIGRAHVCTPVTNAQLVCRLLLEQKKVHVTSNQLVVSTV